MKVRSRDLRYVLIFALLATVVASGGAYELLNPPQTEQFFAMWILGSKGLAQDYYPDNNARLVAGELVNWTLGVYNHMGGLEYVMVRVKLLNSTLISPDELTGTPSPVPPTLEFGRVLVDNETWSIPFVWQLLGVTQQSGRLTITELSINQDVFKGTLASASSGINFRIVFELWFYNVNTNQPSFSWNSKGASHSAWTQIWFNATATG